LLGETQKDNNPMGRSPEEYGWENQAREELGWGWRSQDYDQHPAWPPKKK